MKSQFNDLEDFKNDFGLKYKNSSTNKNDNPQKWNDFFWRVFMWLMIALTVFFIIKSFFQIVEILDTSLNLKTYFFEAIYQSKDSLRQLLQLLPPHS